MIKTARSLNVPINTKVDEERELKVNAKLKRELKVNAKVEKKS
jgi:hypothetical protein